MPKIKKDKTSKLLTKLKFTAYELHKKWQLPNCLTLQIYKLGVDTPKPVYEYYMLLVQHYMRVEGYYKRFPEEDKVVSEDLESVLKEKGYYQ